MVRHAWGGSVICANTEKKESKNVHTKNVLQGGVMYYSNAALQKHLNGGADFCLQYF